MADERHERVRRGLELRSTSVLSSAANVRARRKKPVSLVGDHSSRPSATAHASNEANVAADRPEARSIARWLSSTQSSRSRKKTMTCRGRWRCRIHSPSRVPQHSDESAPSPGSSSSAKRSDLAAGPTRSVRTAPRYRKAFVTMSSRRMFEVMVAPQKDQ